jgi:hypothetical protein
LPIYEITLRSPDGERTKVGQAGGADESDARAAILRTESKLAEANDHAVWTITSVVEVAEGP